MSISCATRDKRPTAGVGSSLYTLEAPGDVFGETSQLCSHLRSHGTKLAWLRVVMEADTDSPVMILEGGACTLKSRASGMRNHTLRRLPKSGRGRGLVVLMASDHFLPSNATSSAEWRLSSGACVDAIHSEQDVIARHSIAPALEGKRNTDDPIRVA